MSQSYVTCALCGHQFPERFVRERGSVQCSCGLRIDTGPGTRRSHHLRSILFLGVAVVLVVGAAVVGRYFVG